MSVHHKKLASKLPDLWNEFRFTELILMSHSGGTEQWKAMKTQELFAKHISLTSLVSRGGVC